MFNKISLSYDFGWEFRHADNQRFKHKILKPNFPGCRNTKCVTIWLGKPNQNCPKRQNARETGANLARLEPLDRAVYSPTKTNLPESMYRNPKMRERRVTSLTRPEPPNKSLYSSAKTNLPACMYAYCNRQPLFKACCVRSLFYPLSLRTQTHKRENKCTNVRYFAPINLLKCFEILRNSPKNDICYFRQELDIFHFH